MVDESIVLSLEAVELEGLLSIPSKAKGIVLFAHGSGSGRFSPRNRLVANILQHQGIATLLVDLLTTEEEQIDERTRALRFDIPLLSQRLMQITDWITKDARTRSYPIGYFGASTGAAAALIAAAQKKKVISAVVSRGGRPDLASSFLAQVKAPTLLIVGERDEEVILLNQQAYKQLSCPKKLEIIPAATHLFEERGCLEKVAAISAEWFSHCFSGRYL